MVILTIFVTILKKKTKNYVGQSELAADHKRGSFWEESKSTNPIWLTPQRQSSHTSSELTEYGQVVGKKRYCLLHSKAYWEMWITSGTKKAKWHWADKEEAQEPSGGSDVRTSGTALVLLLWGTHSFTGLTLSLVLAPIQHVLKDDYVTG